MSEPENTPPAPTPKTAAVPLKKETVRITLRGRPDAPASLEDAPAVPTMAKRVTAPIQLPSAPLPPPAPRTSTVPVKLPVAAAPAPAAPMAPRPPSAPTAPRPMAPPVAGLPAATRPLSQNPAAPAPPPRVETGAPTVSLQKPVVAGPRPPGTSTGPMVGGAAPLPKATVKLAPTQAMQRPSISAPPSAPVKRNTKDDTEQFYEDKDPEAGLVPLSVICFVLSAILMVVQMFGADAVKSDPTGESPIMVPTANAQNWESKSIVSGVWSNNFKTTLLPIP